MKTYSISKEQCDRQRRWILVDAANRPVGRVATEVASLLRGKHKPTFTPHMDCGDHVVVINAGQVALTGRKAEQKMYHRHSGYPGGLTSRSYGDLRAKRPEFMFELVVRRMLPRGSMGREMFRRLHVYGGAEHPHQAQSPKPLSQG